MNVEVSAIDISSIRFTTPEVMDSLATLALEKTSERISSGIGSEGPLAPYAPRTVADRTRLGLETATRDLTRTGDMLALRVVKKVSETRAVIGWTSRKQAKKAYVNNWQTPFIEPLESEVAEIRAAAKELILEQLRNELARVRAEKA